MAEVTYFEAVTGGRKIEIKPAEVERLRGDLESFAATGLPKGGIYQAEDNVNKEVFFNFDHIDVVGFKVRTIK